jgi:hypothetical protein
MTLRHAEPPGERKRAVQVLNSQSSGRQQPVLTGFELPAVKTGLKNK